MIEKLYTVEEVAELASVTGRTIRNYLKSGRLVGRKIGGQWRFPETEVQRLLTGAEDFDSFEEEVALQPAAPAETPWAAPASLPLVEENRTEGKNNTPAYEYLPPAPLPNPAPLPEIEASVPPATYRPNVAEAPISSNYVAAPVRVPAPPEPQMDTRPAAASAPQSNPAPMMASAPVGMQDTYEPRQNTAPLGYESPAVRQADPAPVYQQEPQPQMAAPPCPPPTQPPVANQAPLASQPPMPSAPPVQRTAAPVYQAPAPEAVAPTAPAPSYLPPVYQEPPRPALQTAAMPQPQQVDYSRNIEQTPAGQTQAPPLYAQYPAPAPPYSMPQQAGYPTGAYHSLYGQAVQVPLYPQNPTAYYGFAPPPAETPMPPAKPEKQEPPAPKVAPEESKPEQNADYPPPSQRPAPPDDFVLSDVGKRVTRFVSEVHDCSSGPLMCTIMDTYMSLSSAKNTSERLAEFARLESENGTLCQSYVEYDERYYVARFTLFGSSAFLHRCLQMIG